MKNLVGKKIKGFKYSKKIGYIEEMDKFIGKVGLVVNEFNSYLRIEFDNDAFEYPIAEAIKHLVQEETPQEKVSRLEKELEQAKKELKTKVWILVWRTNDGRIMTHLNASNDQYKIGHKSVNTTLIDIIEREY